MTRDFISVYIFFFANLYCLFVFFTLFERESQSKESGYRTTLMISGQQSLHYSRYFGAQRQLNLFSSGSVSIRTVFACDGFDLLIGTHTFKRGTCPLTLMDFWAILVSHTHTHIRARKHARTSKLWWNRSRLTK